MQRQQQQHADPTPRSLQSHSTAAPSEGSPADPSSSVDQTPRPELTPVLYRSAGDGWRVGNAHKVANPSTVMVRDSRTGLPENVRPGDVVDVVGSGLSVEAIEALLSSAEVPLPGLGDGQPVPHTPRRAPEASTELDESPARTRTHCLRSDDLAELDPSPLTFVGTTIDALRCRFRRAREFVAAGGAEEDGTVVSYVGDNLAYVMRSVPPSGIVPVRPDGQLSEKATNHSLAARAYSSLTLTGKPQSLLFASDRSGQAEFCDTGVTLSQLLGADTAKAERVAAALAVIQAFTHDVAGDQHAMTQLDVWARPKHEYRYSAAQLTVSMLDIERIAWHPEQNMEILGFLAYALSNEEKERCYLPTRKSAKPPACVSLPGQERLSDAIVDRLQQRYFVFCEAIETLRFEVQLQLFLFARVAAAMHLLEVQFAEDGTVQNLAAMRNAAKLISADFNGLSKILTTRQHCVAAAKFLYMATVRFVVGKLNARLNEEGAQPGHDGVIGVASLTSGFAPSVDEAPRKGVPAPVLSLHDLYRHVLFEDFAQRYFVSTDLELSQWQAQGFVLPRSLQASLDPYDNYPQLKLMKAKGGVLATIDAALALLFPHDAAPAREEEEGDGEDDGGAAPGREGGGEAAPGGDGQLAGGEEAAGSEDEAEVIEIPYYLPDRDAMAKMTYASILPEDETDADKPPKKAMAPVELPISNDNLAMMAFIFASLFEPREAVPALKLDAGQRYMATVSPAGNLNFWKATAGPQKPFWSGNLVSDVAQLHVDTAFEAELQVRPSGPKSKPVAVGIRLLNAKAPEDQESHNDLMNLFVRCFLHVSPKGHCSFRAAPVMATPRETAEERDAAAEEAAKGEAALAAARAAMTEEERKQQQQREKIALVRKGFELLSRHNGVHYDAQSHTLLVEHSFGSRTYALPPLGAVAHETAATVPKVGAWLTAHAPVFDEMTTFLLTETDVETQEALVVETQEHDEATLSALFRRDIDMLVERTLGRSDCHFTLCFSFLADGEHLFNGERIEQQLNSCLFRPARALRLALKHHYLPLPPKVIVNNFLPLLPGSKRIAFRAADAGRDRERLYCEEICIAGNVHHVIGPNVALISAHGLLKLQRAMEAGFRSAVDVVQRFARATHAAFVVTRRAHSISEALAKDDEERAAVIALRQWQINNAAQHRMRRLALQEEEFASRRAIADECWIQWVALQTQVQQELEDVMHGVVARRIQERQEAAQRAVRKSQKVAVDALTQRIQTRLLKQGAELDAIVRGKLENDAAASSRFSKMRQAQERLLRTRVAREEERTVLECHIEEKAKREDVVAKAREKRREEIRMELWHRQERERVVREQIEANRQLLEQSKKEEFVMDDVQFKMKRRAEQEIAERQRAQREALRKQFEEERTKRESQLTAQARRQWTASVRREKVATQRRQEEQKRQQRDRVALFQAQEKERVASEKAKADEAKRQKLLTRKLLKAHTMLYQPLLFEQGTDGGTHLVDPATGRSAERSGSKRRSKSAVSAPYAEGFEMSGGKRTYRPMLPHGVWDGIMRHHEQASVDRSIAEANQDGMATPPRSQRRGGSAASPSRLRSASPRSVYSL